MKNFRLYLAALWFIIFSLKLWHHELVAFAYGFMAVGWLAAWYFENHNTPTKQKQERKSW